MRSWFLAVALIAFCTVSGGCAGLGPKYGKPSVATPAAFKEAPPPGDGWKIAEPRDAAVRGKWWEVFQEPELNALEDQVSVSNQNVAAAAASVQQARALVRQARAAYVPTVTARPGVNVQHAGSAGGSGAGAGGIPGTFTEYAAPIDATWQPDLFGRVASQVRANQAQAEVAAADLENTRLSAQAELATDFFLLRGQDELVRVFASTVEAYRHSLELTKSLYRTGIYSKESVAQAETQLETAEAQATNLAILRAQYEHAIAALVGKPASTFSVAAAGLKAAPPVVPVGLPSELLERRPDIAAAERAMAAANAQIGVAMAAYFPSLSLNGEVGIGATTFASLLNAPTFIWSLGASLGETIFDGGLRGAQVDQYKALFDQNVATYRQAVLTAFQQVEDGLSGLRALASEVQQEDLAVRSAQTYLQLATDRYKLGIDPYLTVISAQTALLGNQQTATNLKTQQLTTSVSLILALGGGWDPASLPAEAAGAPGPAPSPKP